MNKITLRIFLSTLKQDTELSYMGGVELLNRPLGLELDLLEYLSENFIDKDILISRTFIYK